MKTYRQTGYTYGYNTTIFTMTTLEYDWEDGTHTTFDGYTIDENSTIRNKKGLLAVAGIVSVCVQSYPFVSFDHGITY